jgi:hypothetical protein
LEESREVGVEANIYNQSKSLSYTDELWVQLFAGFEELNVLAPAI